MTYLFSAPVFKILRRDTSEKDALTQMALVRTWKQLPEFTMLFRPDLEMHWGNDKQVRNKEKAVSQHTISEHVAVNTPREVEQDP